MPALSRSARIWLVLTLDVLLFIVELSVGYAVGSLALVADSFHMLADVLSLVVALYAIKLSGRPSDDRYTYGWGRAEIVAALVNGVFLLALCLSIFLEALGRLVKVEEVSDPKLVVAVGTLGLALNVVGLFVFHEHGHGHAGCESHIDAEVSEIQLPLTPAAIQLPLTPAELPPTPSPEDESTCGHLGHMMRAAEKATDRGESSSDVDYAECSPSPVNGSSSLLFEALPLLESHESQYPPSALAHEHAHGHVHGSMNMRALTLHVLGDALGNAGVIASGLVIWLARWPGRFYLDPAVSLAIAVVVAFSAFSLARSAASVLLQRVPDSVALEDVRAAVRGVPGVQAVRALRVWQLSEHIVVGSARVVLDVHLAPQFAAVAAEIRGRMRACGVHEVVLEPAFGAAAEGEVCATGRTLCVAEDTGR